MIGMNTLSQGNFLRTSFILLLSALMLVSVGCKGRKKKAAEEAARAQAEAKAAQLDRLKSELQSLMDGPVANYAELEDRENRLDEIRAMGVDDPGVQTLIRKVEYFLQQEKDRLDRERAEAEAANNPPPVEPSLKTSLAQSFGRIANAGSVDAANREINQTMSLFASSEAPVFIIIGMFDGQPDYDEPTTINNYLNYLKDQQKNPNRIYKMETNSSGKITLLELIKSN